MYRRSVAGRKRKRVVVLKAWAVVPKCFISGNPTIPLAGISLILKTNRLPPKKLRDLMFFVFFSP